MSRPERVQAAFAVWEGKPELGPSATAMFEYIIRLEAEIARLRALLEPFAESAAYYEIFGIYGGVPVRHLREARAALKPDTGEKPSPLKAIADDIRNGTFKGVKP